VVGLRREASGPDRDEGLAAGVTSTVGARDLWYATPMPLNRWSDDIVIVEFGDEPQFSEDIAAFTRLLEDEKGLEPSAVFDLSGVSYLNSSNIAQLLKLRKQMQAAGRQLRIAGVTDSVWGLIMTAGLDKIMKFTPDTATALASLQLQR
jgi:anti-anti-sigma factor